MKLQLAFAATATATAFAVFAAATPAATSNEVKYKLDTNPSPRVLKTLAEVNALWDATYDAGVTVTRTAPGGTAETLVDNASAECVVALGVNAGGLWSFNNSNEGDATFAVSHSIYGTLGAGTSSDPAKIVYATELFELVEAGTAGAGSYYTWVGANGATPYVPAGYAATETSSGSGVWTLAVDPNAVVSNYLTYWLDTLQDGPNRTIDTRRGYSIAYSGDDWAFSDSSASAASTLSVTKPNGTSDSTSLTGTDSQTFMTNGRGDYTVTLTEGNGTTLTSVITYNPVRGCVVIVK